MQDINPDEKARIEALDPHYSYIVQAPAGSGKTGLLTQRFLILLSQGVESPEECLALTFTKKAAAEMRERILFALEKAKAKVCFDDPYQQRTIELAEKVLNRDQALGWNILDNPNRLKIQTIDAFCASLIRQMPIISGFGSFPLIIEDAYRLYYKASQNLLNDLETKTPWSNAVKTVLRHLDNNLFLAERLLADMLSHRDQWLPYIGHSDSKKASRELLETGLKMVIQEILADLQKSIPPGMEDILELANFAASNLLLTNANSKIIHCISDKNQWPKGQLCDLPYWEGIGELLLTSDNEWRKTVTQQQGFPAPSSANTKEDKLYFQQMKNRMVECLETLSKHNQFHENLKKMRECPTSCYEDHQWQVVVALVQLLPKLSAHLTVVFQQKGEVDFTEITLAARKALGGLDSPSDLALKLDYRLRHILVDEFQDTSLTQFRLLEQLTVGWQPEDGRTLFLVGDPMQSIYRFRQAEVGLFIRAKQKGIGDIKLKSLNLIANFRSDPKLVEWTNAFFKEKFPLQDNMVSGAISFSPSKAVSKSYHNANASIEIVDANTEAQRVVKIVKWHQTHDPEGSIALLVRSRTHLQMILPYLREFNIPYQGVQLDLLIDKPVVQDLIALTRALVHLGDRIAWLAILRAPWCQLSLNDLYYLANHEVDLPLWHTLKTFTKVTELSESGKKVLEQVVPILGEALNQLYRLPLRTLVVNTWVALGGIERLYDDACLKDVEAFLSVLEEDKAIDFYQPGMLEQRMQALYAKTFEPDPYALQIMTIHKAKGLEFDTVIVPGIGRRAMGDSQKLLLWEERISFLKGAYLIMAPIQSAAKNTDRIYQFLKKEESKRASYEATRLWYVAATRARKHLYWLSHDTPSND